MEKAQREKDLALKELNTVKSEKAALERSNRQTCAALERLQEEPNRPLLLSLMDSVSEHPGCILSILVALVLIAMILWLIWSLFHGSTPPSPTPLGQ
ncbi:MAG: hypothetical protein DMF68_16105 [Acidobacteria bacterium]|nr:MAG: hypothetical protein DMF68_16105 [Acidobacteriota bacterium]